MFYALHKVVPLLQQLGSYQLHQQAATFDESMNKLSPAAVCLIVSSHQSAVAATHNTQHKVSFDFAGSTSQAPCVNISKSSPI